MGNRGSAPVQGLADGQSEEVAAVTDSGVYLSQDLQAKVLQDFQSKVLKEEWENRQRKILMLSNERIARDEQCRIDLEKKLEVWRAHNSNIHEQLDSKIDTMKARFADLKVEIDYDTTRLERNLGSGPKFGKGDTCLSARVELTTCFKEASDITKCDRVLEVLENCMKKAVIRQ